MTKCWYQKFVFCGYKDLGKFFKTWKSITYESLNEPMKTSDELEGSCTFYDT